MTKINIVSTIPKEMDWEYFSPLEVKVVGNFDKALKSFRSLVQADGVLALYKEKQGYEKPSEKKRRKKNEAIRRIFEEEVKQEKIISGEYDKEKAKRLARKEQKRKERNDVEENKTVTE